MTFIHLSEKQNKVVGIALTTVSLVVVSVIVMTLLSYILRFFTHFSGVFMPLAVAAILATLLKPYYNWLHVRLKHSGVSVGVVVLTVAAPLGFLSVYFGAKALGQLSSFLSAVPVWIDNIQAFIQEQLPELKVIIEKYDLNTRIRDFLEGSTSVLGDSANAFSSGIVATGALVFEKVAGLLSWVVMPVYFIFLIQTPVFDWQKIEENMTFFKEKTRKDVIYLMSEFVAIIVAFFRGQLIVAFCQGLLFAIGFSVIGLPHGFVIGVVLGFLNIIPYLGNIVGLAVVIPLAWFHPEGGLEMLIGVGIVFTLVQCIEGYILTPRIMGQTTGLHPMAIIFAIFFWGTALQGLLGMILAIPLTAFLVVFWRLLQKSYIKEWF